MRILGKAHLHSSRRHCSIHMSSSRQQQQQQLEATCFAQLLRPGQSAPGTARLAWPDVPAQGKGSVLQLPAKGGWELAPSAGVLGSTRDSSYDSDLSLRAPVEQPAINRCMPACCSLSVCCVVTRRNSQLPASIVDFHC